MEFSVEIKEMNTSQIPPKGWQFYEPSTGWWAPSPIAFTFDQQVVNIIKHRLANPAMMVKHKLSTDPGVVGQQLLQYQAARGAIVLPKPTPPPERPYLSGAVQSAVAVVKKMASGAATLFEWDEAGMPHVEPEVAEKRAIICSTCPKNQEGKSITEYFTVPIAEKYNERFQKLESMGLTTSVDSKLKVCSACLCPLRTKVWFPDALILKRLKPEHRAELDHRCWILAI